MLFSTATYSERRSRLRQLVGSGVIVLLGNNDSPCNFPNNPYKFRQDSSFLYFTGQHLPLWHWCFRWCLPRYVLSESAA